MSAVSPLDPVSSIADLTSTTLWTQTPPRSGRPAGAHGGRGRRTVPRTISVTLEESELYDRLHELTGIGLTELVRSIVMPRARAAVWLAGLADSSGLAVAPAADTPAR